MSQIESPGTCFDGRNTVQRLENTSKKNMKIISSVICSESTAMVTFFPKRRHVGPCYFFEINMSGLIS